MTKISTIKEAWRIMYQDRTCPPYAVLRDPAQTENVAEHRKGCPFCAMKSPEAIDYEAWAELGTQMAHDWPKPQKPSVQVGQIWSLVATKGGWDDRFRHVNPPMVLILDVFEDVSGIRVTQLFDVKALMGDGDVDLGPRFGVAEAWNTYALDQADLDSCFGTVGHDDLDSVRNAVLSEAHIVEDDSIVWHFRQLELEVASFMAMEAIGRLMDRQERNAVRQELADAEMVRGKILAFDPRIRLPKVDDGLKMLAEANLPDELMLKAAAVEGEQLPFTVVSIGGVTNPCRGFLAEVLGSDLEDTVIRITGRLPEECREGLLFAWWRRPDIGLEEGVAEFDPSAGIFNAVFPGKSQLDFNIGEPVLLLVQVNDAQD